jgi:tRNA 2-thiouridine synthesizing protein A
METQEETLDVYGLRCPLPGLLARRRLQQAPAGTVLVVLSDDAMAPIDVPFICAPDGIEALAIERQGDRSRIVLRKPKPG